MMTDPEIEGRLEKIGYVVLAKDKETSLLVLEGDVRKLIEDGKAAWLKR